jgi:hypothetical protein
MTAKFLDYLRRVEVQFRCKGDASGRQDDDRRLYLYCRLQTVADNLKAKATCIQTAETLNVWYTRDLAKNEVWWRA